MLELRAPRVKTIPAGIRAREVERFLEKHRLGFLCSATLVYFAGSGALAWRRPLWFDELFTVHLARLTDVHALWEALRAGVDVTPPLFNLLTRASVAMLGANELGYRFPALFGFWVMCLCLFAFVHRRSSVLHAAAAMLLPICLGAGKYATEARPYGLLLGACGVGLVAWQSAADDRDRSRWAPLVLALALAAATAIHYYGALFAGPLAAGEFVRWRERRKIDWRVASALAAAPLTLLVHVPLIQVAMSYTGGTWSNANIAALLGSYSTLLGSILAPVLISGILIRTGIAIQEGHWSSGLRPWETAATGTLLLLPVVCVVVAKITNGIFTGRYAIATVLGFAIACTLIPLRGSRATRAFVLAACSAVMVYFFAIEIWHSRNFWLAGEGRPEVAQLARLLADKRSWVVIHDPHEYLEMEYYLPKDGRGRLVYVASPEHARRYLSQGDDDRTLLLLRRFVPLHVVDGQTFLGEQQRFQVIGREHDGWLLPHLARSGAHFYAEPWREESGLWTVQRIPRAQAADEGSASRMKRLPASE